MIIYTGERILFERKRETQNISRMFLSAVEDLSEDRTEHIQSLCGDWQTFSALRLSLAHALVSSALR